MSDPTPFEIVERDGAKHASNGAMTLSLLDGDGLLFRRRAVKTTSTTPPTEAVLPRLNELAGELLANPEMPPDAITRRLLDLAETIGPRPSQRIEWAVARLDGVSVYVDGTNVIVTRQDLNP